MQKKGREEDIKANYWWKNRIFIENIFASIKKFKILSDKYRSRTTRFSLRFNLIASILNFELNL